MKGLTHFVMGITIATCFPLAVKASVTDGALILLLGGIFGILPDTLDFRFAKYLEKHDYEVDPDPYNLNPTEIARKMAEAIDEAWDENKKVQIQFHTMKMSADLWRQYKLMIDTDNKKIVCQIGPLVTTGKSPLPGTEPPEDRATGEWPFKADVLHTYDKWTYVDIFSGPDFAFVPEEDHIRVDFIPFHRKWTHSFTVPFLFMPIGFLLYGLTPLGYTAAFIILFSYWGHVLLDQTGMMGSNLLPPFTKKRLPGLGWARSNDAIGNFFTNYMCGALALWNMNYFSPHPVLGSDFVRWFGIQGYWPRYFVGLANLYVYYVIPVLVPLYIIAKVYMKYFWTPEEEELPETATKEERAALEMIQSVEGYEST